MRHDDSKLASSLAKLHANGSTIAPGTAAAADHDAKPSTAYASSTPSDPVATVEVNGDSKGAAPAAPAAEEPLVAAPPVSDASAEQASVEGPQVGGADARVCPLCLGILQAPDAPRPLRTGEAKIALPDMDASGGDWRLLPSGDIAAIAAAARHDINFCCSHNRSQASVQSAQSFPDLKFIALLGLLAWPSLCCCMHLIKSGILLLFSESPRQLTSSCS